MPRPFGAALAVFLTVVSARAGAQTCDFNSSAVVVVNDGKQLLQYWEADDSAKWTSGSMPDSEDLRRFVQYVRARVDVSEPSRYLSPTDSPVPADQYNARLMLAGGIGDLRPIDCLEALLLSEQARRRPMETRPTEFLSFVLRRVDAAGAARLKIWFYTVDRPEIGKIGPLRDLAEADVAAGWKPVLNLHNHNFFLDRTPIMPGGPWPSANDVQAMKEFSFNGVPFERTAVTNGFITSHLTPEELKRFRGADEPVP